MLVEISSSAFKCSNIKNGTIKFHKGLNTIVGNANSIGKSLLLFAIDFAYGGEDYAVIDNSLIKNIGHHTIRFTHNFNGVYRTYERSTANPKLVKEISITDNKLIKDWDADQFRKYLYIQLQDNFKLSFREAINAFTRIALKNTNNVAAPLQAFKDQKSSIQVENLFKIYHIYEKFQKEKEDLTDRKNEVSKYKGAREIKLIESIDKTTKEQYLKRIDELKAIKDEMKNKHKDGVVALDDIQLDELKELRKQLKILKRQRTSMQINIDNISIDMDDLNKNTSANYQELQRFFPNVEFKELNDVIQYTKKLANITKTEKESSIKDLQENIKILDSNILELENSIKNIIPKKNVPTDILDEYSKIDAEIKAKQNAIKKEDEYQEYVSREKTAETNYKEKLEEVIPTFENQMNTDLREENNLFFSHQTAPELTINRTGNSYSLKVIQDTGNASTTRGLIIFDMLTLKKTSIPYVIHDGVITNTLVTENSIKMMQYYSLCGQKLNDKQIFVCMEKGDTYQGELKKLIDSSTAVRLGKNEESLYGKQWNTKD